MYTKPSGTGKKLPQPAELQEGHQSHSAPLSLLTGRDVKFIQFISTECPWKITVRKKSMDVQIKRTKNCPQCVNAFRLQLCPADEWDDSPLYVLWCPSYFIEEMQVNHKYIKEKKM